MSSAWPAVVQPVVFLNSDWQLVKWPGNFSSNCASADLCRTGHQE